MHRVPPWSPVVLVVEEDPHLGDTIATLLENSGYFPALMADGRAALGHVQAGGIDLVLLDLDLQVPSAVDLCRHMRAAARDAAGHLPILLLTPRGQPEDLAAGYAAGADDYVLKPFQPAVLLARVRVCLQRRALARLAPRPAAPGCCT